MNVKISKAAIVRASITLILVVLLLWSIITLGDFAPHSRTGATWENITLGVSGAKQVHMEHGQPDRGGLLMDYYDYDSNSAQDGSAPYLTIGYNLLGRVNSIHIDFIRWRPAYFPEFVEMYGYPDYIATGIGQIMMIIYLNNGLVVQAMPDEDQKPGLVTDAYFFLPCSLECIQQKPFFGATTMGKPEPYHH
jgi:hypothetical protein